MKKKYEAPRVEKMEFDYSETVVASVGDGTEYLTDTASPEKPYCIETHTGRYFYGDGKPGKAGCIEIFN